MTFQDFARCQICGGEIHQWHSAPGRWYHNTVNADGKLFDAFEMWGDYDKWHEGRPDD